MFFISTSETNFIIITLKLEVVLQLKVKGLNIIMGYQFISSLEVPSQNRIMLLPRLLPTYEQIYGIYLLTLTLQLISVLVSQIIL